VDACLNIKPAAIAFGAPANTVLSIQEGRDGKAKSYQVEQFLKHLE